MAKTRKKRRRKHRGTQAGTINTRPRGRPRNKAEARARAKSRSSRRTPEIKPPTWRGAAFKGLAAAAIFFVLTVVIFKQPLTSSVALAAFMAVFYVPLSFYTDRFFYRRRLRQAEQAKLQAAARKRGKREDG